MRTGKSVFLWVAAALLVVVLGTCSRITLSYGAICPRCLQHAGGVEKSVFGIIYYRKEVHRQASGGLMSPDVFGPPVARVDPRLYEEINGHPCPHDFVRTGFCRYSFGMVGCGSFGGRRYEFRHALTENLYRAYRRVPDVGLARESFALIDQRFPIHPGKDAPRPPMQYPFEAEALPNEPLSILLRGLALVNTTAEWRRVLDAARAGDGSLDLLQNPDLLVGKLEHQDPAVRLQAIDQLAAMNTPDAWALLAGCLSDPQTRKHAAERIVWGRHFPLFDAVLEAEERARLADGGSVDQVRYPTETFVSLTPNLAPGEIRTLLAQQRPRVDQLCFAAIRQQNRFEFLDEVLAILNQRPSADAVATVESLIEGPYALDVARTSSGRSAKDAWTTMQADTNMTPVEKMPGYTAGGKRMYRLQQEVVSLGIQRDPANWPKLRDLYGQWVSQRGAEWWAAGFAQAMAESDRAKTLEFLAGELDSRDERLERGSGALAGLGAIADPGPLRALEAFRERSVGSPFGQHPYYRKFLDYALHRCRGIHRWRLVKNADLTYTIEKPADPAG